ncbi:MAG: YneF family protein [Bacilli bacterium]|nr:YneF family protein [Bacilli bacterium]
MLHDIILVVIGLVIGAVIGFFLARHFMKGYFKKNPPINEQMITALMTSMGRKPNSKQVKQVMAQMNRMNK